MNKMILQTNSLRLVKLLKDSKVPADIAMNYFYNGSTKFGLTTNAPRVFPTLESAVQYFTENLPESERTRGQFVTFAYKDADNWVLYVYFGPDTSDENYSNLDYWKQFGETQEEPYTDLQEVISGNKELQELLDSDDQLQETLGEETPSGIIEWGKIHGSIANQIDLINALNTKVEDVLVNNISVVEDKVAKIDMTASNIPYGEGTVADALDKLLYIKPSITSFTGGGNYEIGSIINPVNLKWTINKNIISQSIDQGIGELDKEIRVYTYIEDIFSNKKFTLTITDGINSTSASTSVNFLPKRYWGVNSLDNLTNDEILKLSQELSTSRIQTRTFDCTGGKYFYFVIRKEYCSGIKFKVGGLFNSDFELVTQTLINSKGYEAEYNIYRSGNIQTGSAISVEVL